MPMNKPHLEFERLDMGRDGRRPHGYPAGIKQKILASDIDERRRAEVAPACCVSTRACTRRRPSCMTTGKRST